MARQIIPGDTGSGRVPPETCAPSYSPQVMELHPGSRETQEVVWFHLDTHLRSWNSTPEPVRHRKWLNFTLILTSGLGTPPWSLWGTGSGRVPPETCAPSYSPQVMEFHHGSIETKEVVRFHLDTHLRSWNSTPDPMRHRKWLEFTLILTSGRGIPLRSLWGTGSGWVPPE